VRKYKLVMTDYFHIKSESVLDQIKYAVYTKVNDGTRYALSVVLFRIGRDCLLYEKA
jgi:hypothetical protein